MTIDELTKFLNDRANGMRCPVCDSSDWYVKTENGTVAATNLVDGGLEERLKQVLRELIIEMGGTPPKDDEGEEQPIEILCSCILLRCNHCGRLEFFDRSFIEEQIHGKN